MTHETLKAEAESFLHRCERALEAARQTGAPTWKIEGLEEAIADAREAAADHARLIADLEG